MKLAILLRTMLFKHMLKNIACSMNRKDEDMYDKDWDEEAGAMRFEDDMDTGHPALHGTG
jgi:hypothetical protein